MKTTIIEQEQQAKPDDSYPRLWRGKNSGDVWLQTTEHSSVIIASEADVVGQSGDGFFHCGLFERITTPITIRFEP